MQMYLAVCVLCFGRGLVYAKINLVQSRIMLLSIYIYQLNMNINVWVIIFCSYRLFIMFSLVKSCQFDIIPDQNKIIAANIVATLSIFAA